MSAVVLHYLVTMVELSFESSRSASNDSTDGVQCLTNLKLVVMASTYDNFASTAPGLPFGTCEGAGVKLS